MTVFRADKKDVRFESELQAHPLYRQQWEPVRAWLGRFRGAHSTSDYYELHFDLLARFRALQRLEDQSHDEERRLAAEIRTASRHGGGREQLEPLSSGLSAAKLARQVANASRSIYRDLGDALVWRLLRYQRPLIAALGQGEVVGRLSDEGLETELNEIERLWQDCGLIAVHADITSCVRHGDVLAFKSLDPPQIEIIEAKKSGKFDRSSVQGQRLQRFNELVARGQHAQGARGGPLRFDRPLVAYTTYHAELRELVSAARVKTHVWREIDNGLLLEVWDESNPAGASREVNAKRHEEAMRRAGWTNPDDLIVTSAALRRLRSRRLDHNFASLAPLALTPLALDDAADLLLGGIDFITTLHAPDVEKRLGTRGIVAKLARGADVPNGFLHGERGDVAVDVPAFVREQVQLELMSLDTLTSTIDWFLTQTASHRDTSAQVDFFYDEAGAWESWPGSTLPEAR